MFANKKSFYYLRLFSDLFLLNISFILAAVLAQSFQYPSVKKSYVHSPDGA